jgi:DNA-binding NarL/FixJ family response regulator
MPETTTIRGRIALLEDEPRLAKKLESELCDIPGTSVTVVDNYRAFSKLVQNEEFDAASIDWELYNVEKGGEALRLLGTEQPDAAKVVFTKHELRRDLAIKLKADAFVHKGAERAEYQDSMAKAVRLGQARKILSRLETLGESAGLPNLPAGHWVLEDEEARIRTAAHASVVENILADSGYPNVAPLEEILERRGWWASFDPLAYAELQWREKLLAVCTCADLTPSELAKILQLNDTRAIESLNSPGARKFPVSKAEELADELLSILAWQLRVSGYRPDVMREICRRARMYDRSLNPPPWDSMGLVPYLTEEGRQGIEAAFLWVKK